MPPLLHSFLQPSEGCNSAPKQLLRYPLLNPSPWRPGLFLYLIQGSGTAKDDVDGTLDEALEEIMPAEVVEECVLRSQYPATI